MIKKLHILLLLLGFVFLGYLLHRTGVHRLWEGLVSLGWGLVPFVLLEFVAEGIHTVAWGFCLNERHRRLSWMQLFRIRMAGHAINYLTPTAALGGEATKAALLSSPGKGAEAVGGVLVGKVFAGVGQLMFVAAGSLVVLGSVTLPRPVWVAMFLSGGCVGAGIIIFVLLQKQGKLGMLIRWLAERRFAGQMLRNAAGEVNKVDETLKVIYRDRSRDLLWAVIWHLVAYATGLAQTWWFFHILHQPFPAEAAANVWFLGMWFDLLTFAVPLNLGTLEGSRVFIFRAIGGTAVAGMTYSIAVRLAQLSWAIFGLLNYASMVPPARLRRLRFFQNRLPKVTAAGNPYP